ncbi:methylated-DNA--[protein]-cysteine S-methyltransferase [Zestomonas thermotolerans]|uniref:methylated-DNA--[protein]-cysteine S-methyltransferase n=1 Tax=Zestomonas thermotolerans TaxID=157784 RepID=UPI000484C628|nr:methylated-DNA--[protein]-cysteine S-methyltransferase [Pseudomonas thermotolerans]
MHYRYHDSPLGPLLLAGGRAGLRLLHMDASPAWSTAPDWQPDRGELDEVCRQLDEYFAGRRQRFELPLAPTGSAFQRLVWAALLEIPYGHTWSYAELARHIGQPSAVRAVGSANGANPIAVIIPCHRVIGSNGTLTGYAGGMERKRQLLQLEGAWLL